MAVVYGNMSGLYIETGQYDTAQKYLQRAMDIELALNNKEGLTRTMGNMGILYKRQKNYAKAIECYTAAVQLATEVGDKPSIAFNYDNIGCLYLALAKDSDGNDGRERISNMRPAYLQKAVFYLKESVQMSRFLGLIEALANTYPSLSEAYKLSGNYKAALDAHEQYLLYKDSVFNKENTEKLTRLEIEGEYRRKELADSLKNIEAKKLGALKLQKQQTYTYIGAAAVIVLLGFSFFIVKERRKSDKLLHNILPQEVSKELKDRGATTAKHFDNVTVLFTDFVYFTGAGERMGTQ
jgi:tetratricopeptide (TPR) repeat protein